MLIERGLLRAAEFDLEVLCDRYLDIYAELVGVAPFDNAAN